MDGCWRAGVAKVDITPTVPVYMAGYGNRTKKHEMPVRTSPRSDSTVALRTH